MYFELLHYIFIQHKELKYQKGMLRQKIHKILE